MSVRVQIGFVSSCQLSFSLGQTFKDYQKTQPQLLATNKHIEFRTRPKIPLEVLVLN